MAFNFLLQGRSRRPLFVVVPQPSSHNSNSLYIEFSCHSPSSCIPSTLTATSCLNQAPPPPPPARRLHLLCFLSGLCSLLTATCKMEHQPKSFQSVSKSLKKKTAEPEKCSKNKHVESDQSDLSPARLWLHTWVRRCDISLHACMQ